MPEKRAAFIGLGVMGYPMAGHLARAGWGMRVYNRTAERARQWVQEHGANAQARPRRRLLGLIWRSSAWAMTMTFAGVCLTEVGALSGMAPGSVLVDHTTVSAEVARELAAAANGRGVGFVDAPVSGGQAGAENGQLTIMAGGAAADYERALPAMDCYARFVRLMGPAGAGQLTKMVNQICIAGVLQSLSEGIDFAQRAGLDADAVVEVIAKGAAQSWQMENRAHTMAAGRVRLRLCRAVDAQGPRYRAAHRTRLECETAANGLWSISSTRMWKPRAAAAGTPRASLHG